MVECLLFGALVDAVTALWVYVLRTRPFSVLAYAMFFPGATALCWSLANGSLLEFIYDKSGITQPIKAVVFSVASLAIVYATVNACVQVATTLGWAKKVEQEPSRPRAVHKHNQNYLPGFLRAAGEEVGWRCFLLPCLLQSYSPFKALLISGIVWGFFHVPVMIMLCMLLKPDRPYVTVAVQCVSCMFAAFTHGWVAIKSGFTVWAPSIMHWFWNVYNPLTLGSIYTNTPGQYTGEQWKINGEGLTGCLVMAPLVLLICWELNADLL